MLILLFQNNYEDFFEQLVKKPFIWLKRITISKWF
jgi:hypothetical protein